MIDNKLIPDLDKSAKTNIFINNTASIYTRRYRNSYAFTNIKFFKQLEEVVVSI
jgi:hypothetical protein